MALALITSEECLLKIHACLSLGTLCDRGGKIIKEIRESSGANIKILTENELPICALHNDRVVQ